jgi:membrane fusion protein, multidrug efflux system
MTTKFYRILIILAALALAIDLLGCGENKAPSFERPPAPVTVSAAEERDVPVYLDAVGTSVAREMVSIQPQVSGRITKIHFEDGAYVKRGAPLFTIDPRPYQAEVHVAEAMIAEKKAALEFAKIEFDRVKNLIETKAISQSDYDTRKNAVEVAEAQLKHSRAQLETAKINLSYCFIHSPIEGRAGQRLVDLGNVVDANEEKSLLTIQRMDPIYADFTIPENDLTAVQVNMRRGTLKTEIRLPDDASTVREGSLTFLDNAVQSGTGTVKLRATIPNEDHRFWPGRFVKVRLVLRTEQDAILIPATAPQMSAKGTFVYVVQQDSTAELRPVTVGQQQEDLVVISEGLQPGERVVVSGQLGVTPGGKVRVDQGATPVAGKQSRSASGGTGAES